MRVDTSLEDVLELLRFGVFAVEQAGEVDVEEGGTVEYGISVEVLRNKRPATRLTCDPDRTGLCRCNCQLEFSAVSYSRTHTCA